MRIVTGSDNPTKINAARIAFEKFFPNESIEVIGRKVDSGVSNQPKSENETITGAINRAKRALQATDADFGVGQEGGMNQIENKWFETGWCVVIDKSGLIGIGSSIHMEIPPQLLEHIKNGNELGVATDIAFNTIESGKNAGFFGLMTNGNIDRTNAYADGIISALTRFLHPKLF